MGKFFYRMCRRRGARVLAVLIAAAMGALTASPAWALDVDRAPTQSTWIAVLIAIALIVFVGVPTFKHPKRTHQD